MATESVATILERTAPATIQDWYELVLLFHTLTAIPMTREQRCAHLPSLFRAIVLRLRSPAPQDAAEPPSPDAAEHGATRRLQGYSSAMMVDESRILQVSIFKALHKNRESMDFNRLLPAVITIADEVDAQLSRAVARCVA
jgi:hypothetical protein